jgi:hypothetical protein
MASSLRANLSNRDFIFSTDSRVDPFRSSNVVRYFIPEFGERESKVEI